MRSAYYTGKCNVKNGQTGRLRWTPLPTELSTATENHPLISTVSRRSVLLRGTTAMLTAGWGYEH
jgi:hypothetical protein